ncbi:membrane protein [Geomicrobium sp. JCM 19037]|uniref:YhdT family protein n=1 Tax=unclassified Geomicrobium TaxID=2628951 RepID=UPI00045F48A8|nr:YhdT family protein [Geomicrobium sp. JCM 19037]GAK05700.1 membrane protein [Geomicrobium sp. JCM 19037]
MDRRFKVAHREAWIGVGLAVINFVWWYGFAYGLGSRPVSEYQWVFGMPAWFFYSCVVGSIVMIVLVIIAVRYFFTEVPLEEDDDQ